MATSNIVGANEAGRQLDRIPQELRERAQWVGFRVLRDAESGKLKKDPLSSRTQGRASCDDPSTWRSFEEARRAATHVGFASTSSDPFAFIDLDDCRDPTATKGTTEPRVGC